MDYLIAGALGYYGNGVLQTWKQTKDIGQALTAPIGAIPLLPVALMVPKMGMYVLAGPAAGVAVRYFNLGLGSGNMRYLYYLGAGALAGMVVGPPKISA